MDGAAASTSKSICGWTWHSALNIIPPWSTLFLHIYLVTAATDWEGRVYPAAVGIALLTHDFQLHTAKASRNVCNRFIMRKKLEYWFMTLVLASWYFSHANTWLRIQRLLFWELSTVWDGWCEGTLRAWFWCREWALWTGVWMELLCPVVSLMTGLFPRGPGQEDAR